MANDPVVKPLGLVTQPNRFDQFPRGALVTASGIVIRGPGLLTPAPAFVLYKGSIYNGGTSAPAFLAWPSTKGMVIAQNASGSHWVQNWFDASNSYGNDLFALTPYSVDVSIDAVGGFSHRDRYFFTTNSGVFFNTTLAPTSNTEARPQPAALGTPILSMTYTTSGNPGVLLVNEVCSALAIVTRTLSDGSVMTSPPSAVQVWGPNAATADPQFRVYWDYSGNFQAGDVVSIYRSRKVAAGLNPGATHFKSISYTIATADIAGRVTPLLTDSTQDSQLGEEAYSNPGKSGEVGIKTAPPFAKSCCLFKGHAFYFNLKTPASITLQLAYGMSLNLPTTNLFARKNAVGSRSVTGAIVAAQNVMTGVSASEIVGIAIGQVISDAAIVGGVAHITAVGASTITIDSTWNATSGAKTLAASDVVEVDGVDSVIDSWLGFPLRMLPSASKGIAVRAASANAITGYPSALTDGYTPTAFAIEAERYGDGSFTLRVSNPQNYSPRPASRPSTADTIAPQARANGWAWSENQQPDACPPANIGSVGSGTVYGASVTRDAVFVFASDGLWRITGNGGSVGAGYDWRVDQVDSTLSLSGPHAACTLRDTVYAYTNRGLVAIDSNGVRELSQGVVNDLLPGPPYSVTANIQIAADETNDEIWLGIITGGVMTYYVYNTLTTAFTTVSGFSSADAAISYSRTLQSVISVNTADANAPSASSFQAATVDYQPLTLDDDPASLKQFQEIEYFFRNTNRPSTIQPRWDATTTGSAINVTSVYQDARARAGVPRANAIANYLSPGFVVGAQATLWKFNGLVLRGLRVGGGGKKR